MLPNLQVLKNYILKKEEEKKKDEEIHRLESSFVHVATGGQRQ